MSGTGSWPVVPALAVVVAAYACLFGAAELLRTRAHWRPESTRALVHVVGSLLAVPVPLVLGRRWGVALAVCLAGALAVSRRTRLLPAVHGVRRRTIGEVLFPLGIALAAVVAPGYGQYALGVLVMGLADPAAALVGTRYGHPVRGWPTTATWPGSAAFLAVTLLVAGGFAVALHAGPLPLLLVPALLVTLVEALLTGGWDDLALPTAAAFAFGWMF